MMITTTKLGNYPWLFWIYDTECAIKTTKTKQL